MGTGALAPPLPQQEPPAATGASQRGWLVISWKKMTLWFVFPRWKIPFHGNNGIFFPLLRLLMILLSLLGHAGPVQQLPQLHCNGPAKTPAFEIIQILIKTILYCVFLPMPLPLVHPRTLQRGWSYGERRS